MDLNHIKSQVELSQKAFAEIQKMQSGFHEIIREQLKTAPDLEKPIIEKMQVLMVNVKNLAIQGKTKEAEQLIKDFENECQDIKPKV